LLKYNLKHNTKRDFIVVKMDNSKIQITKNGHEALKGELAELVEKKRPALVKRLANARAEGDLKENSDYQNAKEELIMMEGRIEELDHVIKTASIVSAGVSGTVSIGTKVTVGVNGSKQVFEIVGEWEADPMQKKISHKSPLGQALFGKNVGEKVEVEAPAGKLTYTVNKIE